jgi:outer membrane protein OmpA-like peptidoglycan-associated protein
MVKGVKVDTSKYLVDLAGPLVSSDEIAEAPEERREFTVPHIYYRFNSYSLMDESRRSLDMLTLYMRQNRDVKIEIRSYTDSRGGIDYNLLLSKRRANAVKDYLTGKGISEDRMKTRGLGESVLVSDCTDGVKCTEEQHAVNRRTTFVILEK